VAAAAGADGAVVWTDMHSPVKVGMGRLTI